ncbi:dynactin subunit 4 isoform X3 [Hydra vulgaris]|uniref:Dynactin subunit 4 n=1 Tax=Hydra vulgaris TaxID=6087 RepID=A0ABM4BT35_HYDVU
MKLFSNPIALSVIGTDSHILYRCHCEEYKPITMLYFCRHCTKLRCTKCVTHEVDSFYCPNCLENMPSAEAKLKKNRCANCFDCPSCGHTLSVRATALVGVDESATTDPGNPSSSKKYHYLNCSFCRWTTRDVGLLDQSAPSGGWLDVELPFAKNLQLLLDNYKKLAHQDKIEKERQKISKRRTNLYLMDRYGYALSLGKKRTTSMGSPSSSPLARSSVNSSIHKEAVPLFSDSLTDIPPIDDSYYTNSVSLETVLNLNQSLQTPGTQPHYAKQLYPKQKHLMVRRSQRCKECEHNLCKPEFNPSSIKFKIQLGGMQYCPILQIHKNFHNTHLYQDEENEVILSVTNPLDTVMNISFTKTVDEDLAKATGLIILPTVNIPIAPKDATIEFDGIGNAAVNMFNDDPQIIYQRSSNKISFYAKVKPLVKDADIVVSFNLCYEYKMITAPLITKVEDGQDKECTPQEFPVALAIPIRINFGKVKTH